MSNTRVQLADILAPVLPTEDSASNGWLVFAILLILGIVLWLIKQYRPNPLQRTLRQLKRGQLTPRQAAHTLAQLSPSPALDRLRFQRAEPTAQQLQQLFENESSHE